MGRYDNMEVMSGFSIVGFWAGESFNRDEYLAEFDGCADAVVIFDPKAGVITVYQFTQFMLPSEIAGISFSGISQKKFSSAGYDDSRAKEVFQKVFQLRNTRTFSKI